MGHVHRSGVAADAKKANRRHRRNCRSAPETPTGVTLGFAHPRSLGNNAMWRATTRWDAVDSDVAGRALNVEAYQVQLRATDASGDPVETQSQTGIESTHATGSEFTVHTGTAPAVNYYRELNATPDVIKKNLVGLTTGIAVQVNFYASEQVGVGDPRLKFEVWNATDGTSVTSKNETLSGVNTKLYVGRTFTPAAGKTYEARVSWVSGTGIAQFSHADWHDLGDTAIWTQMVPDDEDPLHAHFRDIPRPRVWFYQTRVRTLNRHQGTKCWSAWSEWTVPISPLNRARIGPPAPTGVALVLDRVEGSRKSSWRAKVKWNEVPWWVPPDSDSLDGAAGYHVQLGVSNDGGTTIANVRNKTVRSGDQDGDVTANANFVGKILGRRHYRARVQAYDADGREGAFSGWTAWASPGGAPDPPVNVTWSNPTAALFVAKWDDPVDLTDVDRYFVQVIRSGGTVVDSGYTSGTRWTYHIPKADRGIVHRVRVRSREENIRTDVDEDVAAAWTLSDESSLIETADVNPAEQWNLEEVRVEDTAGNPMLRINGFPRCKARYTSGQNALHNTPTWIRWGTEDVDTDNFHPATTDNLNAGFDALYNFTLPFDGQYLVILSVTFASNPTGRRQTSIFLNGNHYESATVNPVESGTSVFPLVVLVDADANDTIQTRVFHNAGTALAIPSARLSIVYQGPA